VTGRVNCLTECTMVAHSTSDFMFSEPSGCMGGRAAVLQSGEQSCAGGSAESLQQHSQRSSDKRCEKYFLMPNPIGPKNDPAFLLPPATL